MNLPDVIHLVINGQTVCGDVPRNDDETYMLKGDALDRELLQFFDEAHHGEHAFCELCVEMFLAQDDSEIIH